jgi:hypothetical protein
LHTKLKAMKSITLLFSVFLVTTSLAAQPITIPVVVHILWHDAIEDLSNGRIMAQIASLNLDYRKQNTDINDLTLAFATLAADTEIEFCLASIDPDGQPTDGILRKFVSDPELGGTFNSSKAIYYAAQGGSDAWPADQYINIWVANMPQGIEGFATLPISSQPLSEWGVIVDPEMFGIGPDNPSARDGGRTLTHEIGHYLGLQHPWGPGDGCDTDDLVNDTPLQDGPYVGCPGFPTSSCGSTDLTQNYMQYTDDACRLMFTTGQKTVMWNTLQNLHPGLLSSGGCTTPVSTPIMKSVVCLPNPAHDAFTMKLEEPMSGIVRIFDEQGRCTYTGLLSETSTAQISIVAWPAGVYYVCLLEEDGATGYATFLKI